MKFALFLGCKIPFRLEQYERSSRAILDAFGVTLKTIDFKCCGYPLRSYNFESFMLSAARNIALAEQQRLNIVTLCKCCFGTLKHADYFLRKDDSLRKRINDLLREENLKWKGIIDIRHILSVLYHDVGIHDIKNQIKYSHTGLKVATSYGCHALRPSAIVNFDNPIAPSLFDSLVNVTGAESIQWDKRLACCGSPQWGKNDRLALDFLQQKLSSAKKAGADFLCSSCAHCQIQFDKVQKTELIDSQYNVPSILYSQLLGLSIGLPKKDLGLENNQIKIDKQ